MSDRADYEVDLTAAVSGFDGQKFWGQARAGIIPPADPGAAPVAVLTMQRALRSGSDLYYALHSMRSEDGGESWSPPREQVAFRRRRMPDGREGVVCDFWPKWHAASGVLLGIGHTAYYTPENALQRGYRPRETAYAVYDPAAEEWLPWAELEMPDEEKFHNAGAGCAQRVDLPDGEILLPLYFGHNPGVQTASSTVVRCAFDGRNLRYLEHGTELNTPVQRGFVEPSLARFDGRYFLTLRNDEANHVTAGEDGLHFEEPRPWRFDDGEPLGSYNTQQHWVVRPDALFLVYTRRGLNNDHVFRHRAPLVMARVDTERLCVLRETERALVPERGARLGNFGVCRFRQDETWVVVAEWMQPVGCEDYGSDNSIFIARLRWKD